jgi:sterol desaturase/sphingolipid hydroxylase (fatty acid hydroxylase superfamily)
LGVCLLALAAAAIARAELGQGRRGIALNLGYLTFHVCLRQVAAPLTILLASWLAGCWGGSLILLPDHGWGLLWAVPAYILAMDIAEYVFHRAQYRIPLLWAMHSLHHSDTQLNASTTERHFWLEFILKAVTVYPVVVLLFKVNATVIGIYFMVSLWHFVVHANLRLSLGRFWPCLNTPHYHRLHHSADPRYFNANYASLFPMIDWLCGTAKPGAPGEYPATGLDTGLAPHTLGDAVLWPWRQRRLQKLAQPPHNAAAPAALAALTDSGC